MLLRAKLHFCIDRADTLDDRSIGRKLSRLAGEIAGLEDERRRIIDQYAVDQITGEEYVAANRDLDRQLTALPSRHTACGHFTKRT
jgi:hypothetical protein